MPLPTQSIDLGSGVTMEFVQVPAGRFWMGNRGGEPDEEPLHLMRIPEPLWIGRYPVTQMQYQAVTGENPSEFKDKLTEMGRAGLGRPVEHVSWHDALAFCRKWGDANNKNTFRLSLPTEAQWEYACRAGSGTFYCQGDGQESLSKTAWWGGWNGSGNTRKTNSVGERAANPFGLHDVHGNAWEWCTDIRDSRRYANRPHGFSESLLICKEGEFQIIRGGSWIDLSTRCGSGTRNFLSPAELYHAGFRCILVPTVNSHHSKIDGRSPGGRRPLTPVGAPRPDCPAPGRETGAPVRGW